MAKRKNSKSTYYFHITDVESYKEILSRGLKADEEGYIYFLTSKEVTAYVAYNQLFLEKYALIKIDSRGLSSQPELDLVGEITAVYQRRIKQELIEARFLKLINVYKIDVLAMQNALAEMYSRLIKSNS